MKILSSLSAMGRLAFAVAVLGAQSNSISGSPAGAGVSLPRYKFEAGQELIYEGSSRFQYENGSHGTKDRTTYWVTRPNTNGSWHVVAHYASSFQQSFGKDGKQTSPERKQEELGTFDVFADGQVAHPPEGFESAGLTALLIRLPTDTAGLRAGWETEEKAGNKSLYRLGPHSDAASGKWVFERTEESLFTVIYLSTSTSRIYFDAARGLVTKIESENSQGYGFNGKGTGLTELKSAATKSPEWMAQLDQEASAYEQAAAAVDEAMSAVKKGTQPSEAADRAEKILREALQKAKLPMVAGKIQAQLDQLKSSLQYLTQDKEQETAVLNKPAAEWETTDLDGKKLSLAGYRGKVVVLDFWYRGCGWCIRAMPQIKEVAEHYREKPVAVLGMNTDRDEKDARFVADKLKLDYPILKAEGLPEKYGVRGFPTLIIIDQQGVVRARHVGYSPTLSEELVKTIDGLLAANR